ncbi:MAG: hypothetical protein JXA01_08750 [Dehalococcoidia bacterium]|nr:hypothetical protein [Dehalococcoidia bacterium]
MIKLLKTRAIWFVAAAIIGIIVVGMLLALPAILNADSDDGNRSIADFTKIYKNALLSPLTQAVDEVSDPQIAKFSQKLIQSYELEETTTGISEQSNLSDLLPDLKKINKAAMETPLKEAGKQIQDKELSDFYKRFIKNCGVD